MESLPWEDQEVSFAPSSIPCPLQHALLCVPISFCYFQQRVLQQKPTYLPSPQTISWLGAGALFNLCDCMVSTAPTWHVLNHYMFVEHFINHTPTKNDTLVIKFLATTYSIKVSLISLLYWTLSQQSFLGTYVFSYQWSFNAPFSRGSWGKTWITVS